MSTDRRLKQTPWVNYALIAANVLIFLLTRSQIEALNQFQGRLQPPGVGLNPAVMHELLAGRFPILAFYLQPMWMELHQFLTYQFLHANWAHLLGNMVFLYVFGNSVEDRLGKVGYLFFYLAGGVIAGLGHALTEISPVLGASGAVAGVTGAYLALFPLSNVTIVYWFFFVGAFEISGMVLILFQIVQNVVLHFLGDQGVAYLAHLAGYGYGFTIGMALLLVRVLPREPYDMISLIEHRRRRSQFQQMARRGYRPWDFSTPGEPVPTTAAPPISDAERQLMAQRSRISEALGRHDLATAARLYRELLRTAPRQVMSQQQQLDLANQLMAERRYDAAAAAYELFLQQYAGYPQREQVQLILGLIYARYLGQKPRARELLEAAIPRLHASDRLLAEQVLGEIG